MPGENRDSGVGTDISKIILLFSIQTFPIQKFQILDVSFQRKEVVLPI